MLKNILRSPMSFFDTTPLGRVLNRFSKDIYVIDEVIPRSARTFLFTFFSVLSSLVVIVVTTPTFIIAIIPLGIFYFLVQVNLPTCDNCAVVDFTFFSLLFYVSAPRFCISAFLCGHLSSAEASGVHHSFPHLLSLPGVSPGSIQHPGLPSTRQVHEGE